VPITRDGNEEGPLYGEVVVFTGSISLRRNKAADLISSAGCKVSESVTNKTTLLVVGDQDIRKLAGHDKSRKHREAEKRIREGQSIRILRESDFMRMATCDGY
jgi:DNA polymerase-3 subunit epsilon